MCQEQLGDAKVATAGRESEVSQRVALSGNRALAFLTWTNIETPGGGQTEFVREWTLLPVAQVSCYRKGMVRGLVKAGDHGAEGPVGRCDGQASILRRHVRGVQETRVDTIAGNARIRAG